MRSRIARSNYELLHIYVPKWNSLTCSATSSSSSPWKITKQSNIKQSPSTSTSCYTVPNPNKKYATKSPEILKGRESLCHLRVFLVRICHNSNRSNNTYKNSQSSNQTNKSMTRKGTGTTLMNKTSLYRPCHHQIDPPNTDQRSHIYHKFHAFFHLTIFYELDWFFWTEKEKRKRLFCILNKFATIDQTNHFFSFCIIRIFIWMIFQGQFSVFLFYVL